MSKASTQFRTARPSANPERGRAPKHGTAAVTRPLGSASSLAARLGGGGRPQSTESWTQANPAAPSGRGQVSRLVSISSSWRHASRQQLHGQGQSARGARASASANSGSPAERCEVCSGDQHLPASRLSNIFLQRARIRRQTGRTQPWRLITLNCARCLCLDARSMELETPSAVLPI